MMNMFHEGLGSVLKKVEKGNCRISMNGQIAVKTSTGYKTFDAKSGKLTNCNQFVSSIGDDFFYVAPATKVKKGDIILLASGPACVISADANMVTVMNYETGAYMTIAPEHHMFMGNLYFYEKIFSPMKGMFGKGKMNRIVKLMMMSDMMGNGSGNKNKDQGSNTNLFQMMLMGSMMKNMDGMFDGMFEGLDAGEEIEDTLEATHKTPVTAVEDLEDNDLFMTLFDEL